MVNQYRPLNPKSNEESLRVCAIITLGIATDKELEGLKNYKIEQEKTLAVNVFQKTNPYLTQLKPDEWHLGVHTASFEGRKSKDTTYGLSNQIITCLEHLKTHGGADTLKVLTFMQCDLTPDDMIYFGNTILIYPLSLNYLDFSYNRIGDIGTISFINSFVTSPTGKYPMHHIINLNLSNNGIGDDGTAHIAAYLKHGYMPATTHVNLADNIITDKGALCFAESFNSSVNKLKVLHLEGNKFSTNGIGHFVKALESPKVIDVSIVFEIANKSKSVIDFIEKGLKYAIKQHAQSKWEVDKIRSNVEGEKWKDCKDMALNVGMGLMSDAKTCLGFKSKEAIFACVTAEVSWELFRPETLGCLVDIKDYAVDTLGEFNDSDCCIF